MMQSQNNISKDFTKLKNNQHSLLSYLKYCKNLAMSQLEKGNAFSEFANEDRLILVNPTLTDIQKKPNLIFEHISECICSIFQAIQDRDQELVKLQAQEIIQSVNAYTKDQHKYYQSLIAIEIENSIFINYTKEVIQTQKKKLLLEQKTRNQKQNVQTCHIQYQQTLKTISSLRKNKEYLINLVNQYLQKRYYCPVEQNIPEAKNFIRDTIKIIIAQSMRQKNNQL